MGKSDGKITLEQVQELYEWLQGKDCPKGIYPKAQPHLTETEAFSAIYYLQEKLEVMPDRYELCPVCLKIYDSWYGSCCSDYMTDQSGQQEV